MRSLFTVTKPLVVLSLFDGMSCGLEALKRAGIPVKKYYASEIDKPAIKIAMKNHPEIIQLGCVTKWREWDIEKPDLIIGGSPCQGFSFAGKQVAFDDPRSVLFFHMIDIVNHFQPEFRLLENVRMKQQFIDIITQYMGCEPHFINSAKVSAQNRQRFYWYNWEAPDPEDRGITLADIVHENSWVDRDKSHCIDASYYKGGSRGLGLYLDKSRRQLAFEDIQQYIVPFDKTLRILEAEVGEGKVGYHEPSDTYHIHGKTIKITNRQIVPLDTHHSQDGLHCIAGIEVDGKNLQRNYRQGNRIYGVDGKCPTLSAQSKGGMAGHSELIFNGMYQYPRGKNDGGFRDGDKSATVTANRFEQNYFVLGYLTPDRVNKRQRGQRFSEGEKFYTLTTQDQHGILVEGYIRKLTPIECERLQTLPDGYTEGVSNTQRYKMCGNGWNVETIAHIFRYMPRLNA